jgi:3-oxoacyl-[acyl-carrier protein] reductase
MIGGKSRRILITGGNAGIGLALAKRFAGRHELLLSGRKPHEDVAGLIPAGSAYVVADQIQAEASARALVEGIREQGWDGLDNAVLNAGIGLAPKSGIDTTEAIRQTLDVNLAAAIAQARALYPFLEKSRGTLTLVGSVAHKGSASNPRLCRIQGRIARIGAGAAVRMEWRCLGSGAAPRPGENRHARQGRI